MKSLLPWRKKEDGINQFRREIDTIFNRFFESRFPGEGVFGNEIWMPSVDVSEKKDSIAVKAEIPGVDAKDIEVLVDGRILTIKGERKQEKEEKAESYHRAECYYGSFSRTVELPAEVEPSNVEASCKKGILKIEMKKTKESEPRKIKVITG